ncbi:oxidoreductase [Tamlana sp. 2201CG12-4]|uniref:oxidoreductase n=1 Tax=Tamlana sp. 2201CG12-4 TaxID=3112582 RepID=UPI002DBBADB7|nr:oxidoreductase [Tamlana sp. 2201CG12-4]MEC3907515.1 oxidoreductase [Tamlana sp. 2201CG12-4]
MKKWNEDNIPDLNNKVAIITGGNTGLGYQISLELARKNAKIVMACRTKEKGLKAIQAIEKTLNKKINYEVICLDLTDINSIKEFADAFKQKHKQLDILVNNAGVVSLKEYQVTKDGIEMHMATNHLGHFALTGLLLPQIKQSPNARVVTMSSGGYLFASLDFDDMNWEKREYDRVKCYGASKLANLLFMVELDRLFKRHNYSAVSVGAHPGLSATKGQKGRAEGWFYKAMAQPVKIGALPALMGATAENVEGKTYFGPRWFIRGYPKPSKLKEIVFDETQAKSLWEFSEKKTGVNYEF